MATTTTKTVESDGSFACACGKVAVDVIQPKSSTFVKPTAALCQCTDCYSFASAVAAYRNDSLAHSSRYVDVLTPSNAIDMRQIYKSDAIKIVGEGNLQGVKLQENSACIRYYSTCCGTPMMIDYTKAPFLLVFQNTIIIINNCKTETPFTRITPSVVLNHQSAPPESAPTPEGIPIRDGVSLSFISHAILRALFGMLGGKKDSVIAPQLEKIPVSIGLDSIRQEKDGVPED